MEIEKVYKVTIEFEIPSLGHNINFDELVEQFNCKISDGAGLYPYIVIEGPDRRDVEDSYDECLAEIKKIGGWIT